MLLFHWFSEITVVYVLWSVVIKKKDTQENRLYTAFLFVSNLNLVLIFCRHYFYRLTQVVRWKLVFKVNRGLMQRFNHSSKTLNMLPWIRIYFHARFRLKMFDYFDSTRERVSDIQPPAISFYNLSFFVIVNVWIG